MSQVKTIVGTVITAALTAAVVVPLLAINAQSQSNADELRTNISEMKTISSQINDPEFDKIAGKLKLDDTATYASNTEAISQSFLGNQTLSFVFDRLPGTAALFSAAEESDRLEKQLAVDKVRGKFKALNEAKHLCELLSQGSVHDIVSDGANAEFFKTKNMADNLGYYLQYCDATGDKFEQVSETKTS